MIVKNSSAFWEKNQPLYVYRSISGRDKQIIPGDILGILENSIFTVDNTVNDAVFNLLDEMIDEYSSVINLFYGEELNESDADMLKEQLESRYDECDVYMHFGGQPVYYYIISVE